MSYDPPQAVEAEQSVLGAVMQSSDAPKLMAALGRTLAVEDFYRPAHQVIWRALTDLDEQGSSLDTMTLSGELERRNELGKVGGGVYLHTLLQAAPIGMESAVHGWAEDVAAAARRRRAVEAGARIQHIASTGTADDTAAAIDQVRAELDRADTSRRGVDIADAATLGAEALERYASPEEPSIPMGYPDLDRLTGGLKGGQLVVVAARPGVGKSTLASAATVNACKRGVPSLFASLEMSREEVIDGVLSNLASVDKTAMNSRNLESADWDRLRRAQERLGELPLHVVDDQYLTVPAIRTIARELSRTVQLGWIVVDYLQLMRSAQRVESRQQEVSEFSRSLKLLGKELDVPVIALSQLNRGPEQRPDKKPTMSDLRESGSLEQDADKVLLLHHDSDDEIKASSEITVTVAKNRQGATGNITLGWSPHYTRAYSMA